MRPFFFAALPLVLLTACAGEPQRDYESSAACNARGIPAGTPEFEKCVNEESQGRMLEQQRREYQQMKEDEEYWRRVRMR